LISNNFVNVQNLFVKLLPFFSKKNRKQEIEEREFFRLMMNMMRSMGNLIWRVQNNDSMGLLSWFVLYWLGYLDCGVNLNGKFNPTALYAARSTKWMKWIYWKTILVYSFLLLMMTRSRSFCFLFMCCVLFKKKLRIKMIKLVN
jgi:hypothetical protein